jgi:glycosyltransferase involved in cell wall biosynthesis
MILMYHKVAPVSPTIWWVEVDEFYRQMWELKNKKIVYLDDYDPHDNSQVVITFDGIYKNVLQYAAPIMKKFGYPFELFITSNYLGLDNKFDTVEPLAEFTSIEELLELEKLGGRIQWHTHSHPDMLDVSDEVQIVKELSVPISLKEVFNESSFRWFAYPHGNFNELVLKHTKKMFTGGITCNQGNDYDKYILNRLTVENSTSFRDQKIACIVASYNYGHFLSEAIDSVLKQTIPPDEILITDDCSSDNTMDIALGYCKKYPELIKYNRNETNLGIVSNFNKAVALTKADYILFLGGDNRFLSNYIEETAGLLNEDKTVGIAYTDFHFFGSRARVAYDQSNAKYKAGIIEDKYFHIKFPHFTNPDSLKSENYIHGSSMYRRTAFEKAGGYVDNKYHPEDHNLFYRITSAGFSAKKAVNTTLEYRQHSTDQANNKFTSYATLMHYISRSKDLERELNEITNSSEYRIFGKYLKFKKGFRNLGNMVKTGRYRDIARKIKARFKK